MLSRWITVVVAGLTSLALAAAAEAQKTTPVHPGKGGSPHVMTEWTVHGAAVSITYGRPYLKGRTPGKDVDPYDGKVWRTGADEATTLKTSRDLDIGGTTVPAGTYTLWTIPQGGTWKLIVNRQTGQWGTSYDEKQDFARIDMKLGTAGKPVEQLTISLENNILRIEWGTHSATVPVNVKG